jgi:hypothetical protein
LSTEAEAIICLAWRYGKLRVESLQTTKSFPVFEGVQQDATTWQTGEDVDPALHQKSGQYAAPSVNKTFLALF